MQFGVEIVMTAVLWSFRSFDIPSRVHAYLQLCCFLNFLVSQKIYFCVGVRFSSTEILPFWFWFWFAVFGVDLWSRVVMVSGLFGVCFLN